MAGAGANSRLEVLTGYLRWRAFGRLTLNDKTADQLLVDAITQGSLDNANQVRSFSVGGVGEDASLVAPVIPARLTARDILARFAAVMVLTPKTLPEAAPVELVQSLFDLTSAEARVAWALADGRTVDDTAFEAGVSANTVRAHVRRAGQAGLRKTGRGYGDADGDFGDNVRGSR